jgi:subtilisin family serine protease
MRLRARLPVFVTIAVAIACSVALRSQPQAPGKFSLHPDERDRRNPRSSAGGQTLLVQARQFVRADAAAAQFGVTGEGLTAAVLDTGIQANHVDFHGRIAAVRNFAFGSPLDVNDGEGHGTNVAGIIAARQKAKKSTDPVGEHQGVAPDAQLAILKVLDDQGNGDFAWVDDALDWVLANADAYGVTVVNISISDSWNYQSDATFASHAITQKIAKLKARDIPVVVAAGNDFFPHNSEQGMAFPAILRDTISVGAFYDANLNQRQVYRSGAIAEMTAPGRLTPFSQRFHESLAVPNAAALRTDIFGPGALITSSGVAYKAGPNGTKVLDDRGESDQQGTSQAAPIVTGTILLMQQFHKKTKGTLPKVDDLVTWMRDGARQEVDNYGAADNVTNTGLQYLRLDVVGALEAEKKAITGGAQ